MNSKQQNFGLAVKVIIQTTIKLTDVTHSQLLMNQGQNYRLHLEDINDQYKHQKGQKGNLKLLSQMAGTMIDRLQQEKSQQISQQAKQQLIKLLSKISNVLKVTKDNIEELQNIEIKQEIEKILQDIIQWQI